VSLTELQQRYRAGEIDKSAYIDQMFELHKVLMDYAAFLPNTDISLIEIVDREVLMTVRSSGVRIYVNTDKRTATLESLNFGSYEVDDLLMMSQLIKAGNTVFDIGANIGWYSLHLSKRIAGVRVFAFEPVPNTYRSLVRNIAINNGCDIQPFNIGFSDRQGTIDFFYDPAVSVRASAAKLVDSDQLTKIVCTIRTLDDFVVERGVGIDFIKCDVEGGELLVLRGAMGTLARDKPIVFAEMLRKWSAKFNYHPNDIISLMGNVGYTCFVTKANKLVQVKEVTEQTVETNFFFLNSQRHSDLIRSLVG
jgi:FkbM family methyltransferase